MTTQDLDYSTTIPITGDSGERSDEMSIKPTIDGQPVGAITWNRPLKNLRNRTEIVRRSLEDLFHKTDSQRWFIAGGDSAGAQDPGEEMPSLVWNKTTGIFLTSTFVLQNLVSPEQSVREVREYTFTGTPDGVLTFNLATLDVLRAYNGANRIKLVWEKTTAASLASAASPGYCDILLSGSPVHIITIRIRDDDQTRLDHVQIAITAASTALTALGVELIITINDDVVVPWDDIPDTIEPAASNFKVYTFSKTYERELHYITPAAVSDFFDTAENALLDGDTLAIAYVTYEDRRKRYSGDGGDPVVVVGDLFNSRLNPEKLANCLPLCKRIGDDLYWIDGTICDGSMAITDVTYYGENGKTLLTLAGRIPLAAHTSATPRSSDSLAEGIEFVENTRNHLLDRLNNKLSLNASETITGRTRWVAEADRLISWTTEFRNYKMFSNAITAGATGDPVAALDATTESLTALSSDILFYASDYKKLTLQNASGFSVTQNLSVRRTDLSVLESTLAAHTDVCSAESLFVSGAEITTATVDKLVSRYSNLSVTGGDGVELYENLTTIGLYPASGSPVTVHRLARNYTTIEHVGTAVVSAIGLENNTIEIAGEVVKSCHGDFLRVQAEATSSGFIEGLYGRFTSVECDAVLNITEAELDTLVDSPDVISYFSAKLSATRSLLKLTKGVTAAGGIAAESGSVYIHPTTASVFNSPVYGQESEIKVYSTVSNSSTIPYMYGNKSRVFLDYYGTVPTIPADSYAAIIREARGSLHEVALSHIKPTLDTSLDVAGTETLVTFTHAKWRNAAAEEEADLHRLIGHNISVSITLETVTTAQDPDELLSLTSDVIGTDTVLNIHKDGGDALFKGNAVTQHTKTYGAASQYANNASNNLWHDCHSTFLSACTNIRLRKSHSVADTLTAVLRDEALGKMSFYGVEGTAYTLMASVGANTGQSTVTNDIPAHIALGSTGMSQFYNIQGLVFEDKTCSAPGWVQLSAGYSGINITAVTNNLVRLLLPWEDIATADNPAHDPPDSAADIAEYCNYNYDEYYKNTPPMIWICNSKGSTLNIETSVTTNLTAFGEFAAATTIDDGMAACFVRSVKSPYKWVRIS